MYFGSNEGIVFRPPSEAKSWLLRATIGCSHNKCTFCSMYKNVKFRTLSEFEISQQLEQAQPYSASIKRVFLCDGDALSLNNTNLLSILKHLKQHFPQIQRISSYATTNNILHKSIKDLKNLQAAGLRLVYLGLETGDNNLLVKINKGHSASDAVAAAEKLREAGIKLSVTFINGLAGQNGWEEHACATAKIVSKMRPNMLSALTLMLHKGNQYWDDYQNKKWQPLSPAELAREMHLFFASLNWSQGKEGSTIFRSNHVSNLFNLAGNIPRDIPRLLEDCRIAENKLHHLDNSEYEYLNGNY